ncbi:MAG: hypothetical protein ABFC84_18415 [Veillonellales bacterium]
MEALQIAASLPLLAMTESFFAFILKRFVIANDSEAISYFRFTASRLAMPWLTPVDDNYNAFYP